MAHRLLMGLPPKPVKQVVQKFKYLLVTDFEATCERNILLQPQEIIELPCLAVSTKDWKVENVFHEYVKPKFHPELTSFCTELTGILQEMVEDQPHFPEVFSQFCNWLTENDYWTESDKSAFVTCGDWDLRVMLPNQCSLENLTLPNQFTQWIDLKKIFCDATGYYPRSLKDMLIRLNLPIEGHLHSGIMDSHNMVRIIQTLARKNTEFNLTSKLKKLDSIVM